MLCVHNHTCFRDVGVATEHVVWYTGGVCVEVGEDQRVRESSQAFIKHCYCFKFIMIIIIIGRGGGGGGEIP